MNIPTKKECYGLIHEMEMMDHIVAHSEQVCRVALFLTARLAGAGIILNRELVRASAMLHDITKTRSFQTKENHAETGGRYLKELGYPEVGCIVEQHVRLDAYVFSNPPTEAAIINYADKRVLHDQIVSLENRMDYILERYGDGAKNRDRILRLWDKSKDLEKQIFRYLPDKPDELSRKI